MDIINNIIHYFKDKDNKNEASSPEGTCPICWGYQQYDGKIRKLLIDKQIDINNHKDSYMLIQDFMKQNIDGIKLKEGWIIYTTEGYGINDEQALIQPIIFSPQMYGEIVVYNVNTKERVRLTHNKWEEGTPLWVE